MQNNKIENTERPSADTSSSLVNAQNTQENSGATASYPAATCSAWVPIKRDTEKVNIVDLISATDELSSLSGRSKAATYNYIRSYVVSGKDSKFGLNFSIARSQNQRIRRRLENLRASYLGHQQYGQLHLKLPSSLEYNRSFDNHQTQVMA